MATFSGQRVPIGVAAPESPHKIGQRAGDQEILLHEAQSLPRGRGVVRIEHSREGFGRERFGQGADEIAAAESLKVEVVRRRRGPEPKRIDGLAAVAHHRAIKRDADQTRRLADDCAQGPAAHLERAVQLDFDLLLRPSDLPRVRAAKPVVRLFVLPAVLRWTGGTCRIHTADRSPWPGAASWPSSRGSTPPGARARRYPGPRRVPVRAGRANRGSSA